MESVVNAAEKDLGFGIPLAPWDARRNNPSVRWRCELEENTWILGVLSLNYFLCEHHLQQVTEKAGLGCPQQ